MDMISRQAAIDAFDTHADEIIIGGEENARNVLNYLNKVIDTIKALPSAQLDIIRCKDCKWYGRADKRRFYRGMDCLQKRIDTIIPDKDFCSRAERREE